MTVVAAAGLLLVAPTAEAHGDAVVTVDTAGLNVRQTPSTDLPRVGLIYMGMQFDYVDRKGDWVLIDYKGQERWVHGAYVKISNEPVVFSTEKATPPAKETKKVSTKETKKVSTSQATVSSGKQVTMNVSAYTAQCVGCSGITASGFDVRNTVTKDGMRIVAAPSNYPFGTIMDIPGYGKAIVLDRGGAIKGNKLDLLVATRDEAIQWGRRNVTVTVY